MFLFFNFYENIRIVIFKKIQLFKNKKIVNLKLNG